VNDESQKSMSSGLRELLLSALSLNASSRMERFVNATSEDWQETVRLSDLHRVLLLCIGNKGLDVEIPAGVVQTLRSR
jgi:hypothetical protein